MRFAQLEKNEVIRTLVNTILSDKEFKAKCKDNFDQIFEDGKVDRDDIPLIINLVLTIYKNHNKVKISKNHLKGVFMLLITRLLVEFNGKSDLDVNVIMLLVEPQIDLLLMTINIKCSLPCCSRPSDNDEQVNLMNQRMKLNKIEKNLAILSATKVVVPKPIPESEPEAESEAEAESVLPKQPIVSEPIVSE